jgi:hypothetical protein
MLTPLHEKDILIIYIPVSAKSFNTFFTVAPDVVDSQIVLLRVDNLIDSLA